MESNTHFPVTPSGNQPVGKVAILYGTVKAVATDGTERALAPNSPIFYGDHIITGSDGMVSIIFDDDLTQLDLGRMSDALVDQEVVGVAQAAAEDVAGEVADIQQALVEGDIEQILDLPAPAAGGGVAGAGGGHPYPKFDIDGDAVLAGFGQETTGITYSSLDPTGGGVVAEEVPATPPEPAPGPPEDIPPPPPPPPPQDFTPTVTVTDGMVWESGLAEIGSGIPEDGSVKAEGVINYTSPDGLEAMEVQDKNGNWIDVTAGGTVVGQYGTLVVSVSPAGEYSWEYTLSQNWLEHDNTTTDNVPGDRGVDDQLFDNFATRVVDPDGDSTDADGIQPSEIITIAINDDGPSIGDPQDAILANEAENALIGDLDITFGADGQATVVEALTLNPLDDQGNKVNHLDPVVDNDGNPMTSGEMPLIWLDNGDGSWSAVVDYGGNEIMTVFTIIPGADNNSYEVVMHGELDGGTVVETPVDVFDEGGGSSQPNYNATGIHYRTIETDGDFKIYMTATIPNDSGGFDENQKVNWSNQGTGVGNDAIDGSDDGTGTDYQTESEALVIRLYENEAFNEDGSLNPEYSDDLYSVTSATFILDKLDAKEVQGNKVNPEETSYWYAYEDGVLVGDGDVPGESQGASDKADQTITIDSGDLDIGDEFDTVIFTGATLTDGDNDGYRVKVDEMIVEEDSGDHTITVEFTATDGDLDQATDTFDVTFDYDGDIEGTVENEVISGSTGDDEISGGGGDDVIMGNEGDDIISGGGGDDVLFGDEGDDTLSGDAGDDQLVGGADNEDSGGTGDVIDGGTGDDELFAGDETGGDGADTVTGGDGTDTADGVADADNDEVPDAGEPDNVDGTVEELDTLVPPVEPTT